MIPRRSSFERVGRHTLANAERQGRRSLQYDSHSGSFVKQFLQIQTPTHLNAVTMLWTAADFRKEAE